MNVHLAAVIFTTAVCLVLASPTDSSDTESLVQEALPSSRCHQPLCPLCRGPRSRFLRLQPTLSPRTCNRTMPRLSSPAPVWSACQVRVAWATIILCTCFCSHISSSTVGSPTACGPTVGAMVSSLLLWDKEGSSLRGRRATLLPSPTFGMALPVTRQCVASKLLSPTRPITRLPWVLSVLLVRS
jgi:hypothetical protein